MADGAREDVDFRVPARPPRAEGLDLAAHHGGEAETWRKAAMRPRGCQIYMEALRISTQLLLSDCFGGCSPWCRRCLRFIYTTLSCLCLFIPQIKGTRGQTQVNFSSPSPCPVSY